MISKQDELINEASATAFQLSQEEMIRLQCQAREDYYRRQRSVQHMLDTQENTIKNQEQMINGQKEIINNQEEMINNQKETIKKQNTDIEKDKMTIQNLTDENTLLQKQLADALEQLKKNK